jgi:hypothetical protein
MSSSLYYLFFFLSIFSYYLLSLFLCISLPSPPISLSVYPSFLNLSLSVSSQLYLPILPVPYSSLSPHFCNSFPQSPAFFFIYLYCKLTQPIRKKGWILFRIISIRIRNPECRHAIKPSESVYDSQILKEQLTVLV